MPLDVIFKNLDEACVVDRNLHLLNSGVNAHSQFPIQQGKFSLDDYFGAMHMPEPADKRDKAPGASEAWQMMGFQEDRTKAIYLS